MSDITIKKAEALFAGEAVFTAASDSPENLFATHFPEIAFIGRSNVGKSSLINALTDKEIARTSNTPGRTQQLIFFRMGDRFVLVDMPGYGFAEAPGKIISAWNDLIDHFLQERRTLRRLCVLVDSRHGLKDNDRDFMLKLSKYAVSFVVVLTKTDKIHPNELAKVIAATTAELKNYGCAWPEIFATSAEKKHGLEALRLFLAQSIV